MNERREFVKKEKIYSLTVKGDNTLKTFFEKILCLPKEGKEWGEAEKVKLTITIIHIKKRSGIL